MLHDKALVVMILF